MQGRCPCTPPKNFLEKVLWNLKNLKIYYLIFFKFLGVQNPFFKKGSGGVRGETPARPIALDSLVAHSQKIQIGK
jgi:hypothetical protein